MDEKGYSVVHLLGVKIHSLKKDAFFNQLFEYLKTRQKSVIANVNLRAMNLAYENEWYKEFINAADLVFCDGEGVRLGARLRGMKIVERFTPADWVWEFSMLAEKRGVTFFLLGNPPGVAERAARTLREKFPNLLIVGVHDGFFDHRRESPENRAVLGMIKQLKPDITFVGMGMPLQERWVMENLNQLETRMIITCGALFEYICGDLKRGPAWMTQNSFEWLARILISPRRYFHRYLSDIPKFYWRVLWYRDSQ